MFDPAREDDRADTPREDDNTDGDLASDQSENLSILSDGVGFGFGVPPALP